MATGKRGNPKMIAGAPSLNPSGRSHKQVVTAASIAEYISNATDGGMELIARLLEMSRAPGTPWRERVLVTTELISRMVGRPLQPSELTLALNPQQNVEALKAMAPAERLAWLDDERARLRLAPVKALALPQPDPDDTYTTDPDDETDDETEDTDHDQ